MAVEIPERIIEIGLLRHYKDGSTKKYTIKIPILQTLLLATITYIGYDIYSTYQTGQRAEDLGYKAGIAYTALHPEKYEMGGFYATALRQGYPAGESKKLLKILEISKNNSPLLTATEFMKKINYSTFKKLELHESQLSAKTLEEILKTE